MSQEKAQLIAPQGHFTVPGLNVAGVVTASSFSGNCTGTASSIAQGTNVVVGVMTASSFAGDVFGNAAGLSTTTAGLKLGIVTSTSFAGNFTGIGSGLTGTPNIVAGLVTASQFVGNTPGLAAGISAGKNLAAGIVTATTFYGDGSALTGAGSTAFIRQTVSSGSSTNSTRNINLNDGNIINLNMSGTPTLAFYNAKTADDITIVRPLTDPTLTTGGVDFDGTGDYLSLADSTDWDLGTNFTIEAWIYPTSFANSFSTICSQYASGADNEWYFSVVNNGKLFFRWWPSGERESTSGDIALNTWTHVAASCNSGTIQLYINGTASGSTTGSVDVGTAAAPLYIGHQGASGTNYPFNGIISNLRIVKGTAVYTSDFPAPLVDLTNVTNTKLLCCQDTSSTTVGAVKPGTITANGDPTAGSQSITQTLASTITWPTSITWNGGSAPTLLGSNLYSLAGQVFNLTTADGGTTWYGYEEVNNSSPGPRELWGWGRNNNGTVGANSAQPAHISSPTQIGSGTDWKDVAHKSGYTGYVSMVSKTDGTLWVWGENTTGYLGLNSTVSYSSPVQLPGTTWGTTKDTMAAGSRGAMNIRTDGTLWSWGYNTSGQVGDNSKTHRSSPVQIPGTTWAKAAMGEGISSAIRTDGTLWVWGNTYQGALGLNQGGAGDVAVSSPTQIPGSWSKVSVGFYETYAIKTDGTLWGFGNNADGQLAQNTSGNPAKRSSPVQVGSDTTWEYVKGGYKYALATKTDGTLWAFGENNYGGLGQNNRTQYSSPVQIPGTNWDGESLSGGASENASGVLKTDGTLWVWGRNHWGELGQNSRTDYSSPVQVPGSWGKLTGPLDLGGFHALTQAT